MVNSLEPAPVAIIGLLKRLAGACLGAGLVYVLLRDARLEQLVDPLRRVPSTVWVLAAAGWWLSFLFRAFRLQQEWRSRGILRLGHALQMVLIHTVSVLALPFRMGEAVYPMLLRQALKASWGETVQSLVWLRFQDAVVLAGLGLMLWPGLSWWMRGWTMAVGVATACMVRVLWRRRASLHIGWGRLESVFRRSRWQDGWGWSAANWMVKLLVVGLLLSWMLPISSLSGVQAAVGGELMALLPLQGPAGLGTYEAGVWLALSRTNQSMGQVALAALAVHLFCLLLSLGLAVGALAFSPMRAKDFLFLKRDGH